MENHKMKLLMKLNKLTIILSVVGISLGAIGGYAYWFYIGCNSGICLITSNPTNSTIYGMVMGFLVAGIFKDWLKESKNKKNTTL